ncbi:30S ribosomal protein S17e [Candidatus Bathyarchaeota archaeon RBG_13_52_12]|nr:MAG: 30S ribosomal protein S17e [Candidatus Bathyarchaeota archaeon RBG_13_52_12]
MGKVRTEMVKRTTLELINKYSKSFNTDFDHNKKFMAELNIGVSKKMRNKVAGYATRVVKSDLIAIEVEGEVEPENI